MLSGVRGWVAGRVVERFDVGDHTAFVLELFAGEVGDDSGPQLGFQAVRGFNPGHEARDHRLPWPPMADSETTEAAGVLRDVLGEVGDRPCPTTALKVACESLRAGLRDGEPVVVALAGAAGVAPDAAPEEDEELWLALAAGAVSPAGADPEALSLIGWLGAVAALTLWGPGTQADAAALATYVAESEEGELVHLEAMFVPVVERWAALGALDPTERLTPLGWWGLPEAQLRAWS